MSRFRSLFALSALILAAGLFAVGGSTPDAAAAGAAAPAPAPAPSAPYLVEIRLGDGSVNVLNVLAWSHEVIQTTTTTSAGGLPTGKRQHKPFVITKELDKSSPILLKVCATGEHLPQLQLNAFRTRQGRQEVYLTITLENAMVSSFQTSGVGDTGPSTSPHELEHVSFTYTKIEFNYRDLGVVFEDDFSDE